MPLSGAAGEPGAMRPDAQALLAERERAGPLTASEPAARRKRQPTLGGTLPPELLAAVALELAGGLVAQARGRPGRRGLPPARVPIVRLELAGAACRWLELAGRLIAEGARA